MATTVGQDHEWAAGDETYVRHLLAHGRVVVAEDGRDAVGLLDPERAVPSPALA